jgi:hypothetical protein
MFIIASTGRCGTQAICNGLAQFSDYQVRHEPEPLMLHEAFLKHHAKPYLTNEFQERLRFFTERATQPYGESVRAPNLLPDIQAVAPQTRFLIVVRHPLRYVVSAHYMRVYQKGGIWDETRIVPLEVESQLAALTLSEKIAWHWVGLNRYLLSFVESSVASVRLVLLDQLVRDLPRWASFLGVNILDPEGLSNFLQQRPNAATTLEVPDGYDEGRLWDICRPEWNRAQALANVPPIGQEKQVSG